jgi:hypothetical protein
MVDYTIPNSSRFILPFFIPIRVPARRPPL